MLILNDTGTDAVNADVAFAFSIGNTPDGTDVLVAYGPGVNTILAAVGDRPKRAVEAIAKAHKEGWKLLDLLDLLGARPNIAVAKQGLIVPGNGQPGQPS
jgi:hypothetical protein